MKLAKVKVTNFRSIEDSGEFEIGELTCLVGKNEAGKTALLKAIQGVNSTNSFAYDKTKDYPRRYLTKFDQRHTSGESEVAHTTWLLNENELTKINELLGEGVLSSTEIEITSYIGGDSNGWIIPINMNAYISNLKAWYSLSDADIEPIKNAKSSEEIYSILNGLEERTEAQESLKTELASYPSHSIISKLIETLEKSLPSFFYTSHFERMSGEISINQLANDKQHNVVNAGDQIFLDFLEYAGTSIAELRDAPKLEELIALCEGASNDITDEIFEFWSQNDALSVEITLHDGRPEDPPPFNIGKIAKIRIENQHHRVTVPLSERSAGFVWFFSFLAQFKQLKKTAGNAIILLDEPGLTLHGKAQADLLKYICERILPEHQVIYTTHSPFMVPAQRLADVRVVEDIVDYSNPRRPVVKGTKVSADVLSVDRDTVFPLQAHLGYEITQNLFLGKNTLIVEGPSDVLYLQTVSAALQSRKRTYLDPKWAICPAGGLDKIISFASLFAGNRLNIVALCDYGKGDKSKVEKLKKSEILRKDQVLTAADFTNKAESDIEDLFDADLYCDLVSLALGLDKSDKLDTATVMNNAPNTECVVKKVESVCRTLPAHITEFNHFLPANYLLRNPELLEQDSESVCKTLDNFEKVFMAINGFLTTD